MGRYTFRSEEFLPGRNLSGKANVVTSCCTLAAGGSEMGVRKAESKMVAQGRAPRLDEPKAIPTKNYVTDYLT